MITTDKELRIVRGNDFTTMMTITALYPDGQKIEDFNLADATDLEVSYHLAGQTVGISEYLIDGNNLIITWDDMELGRYGFEIIGKYNGSDWRMAVPFLFQIVSNNAKANIPQGCFENGVYQLNAWLNLLANGGNIIQSDWDETNTLSPSYIRNKPDLGVYATKQQLNNTQQQLQHNIDQEETRAKAAEKKNADDIDAEELARQQADQTLQRNIDAEATARQNADTTLQGNINAEENRAKGVEQGLDGRLTTAEGDIDNIESKIPLQASSQNQLADKEFVNSSIATATATYRGAYNLVTDLGLTTSATEQQIAAALAAKMTELGVTPDNNDYAFVQIPTANDKPTEIARVDRYKYNGSVWMLEYSLNNSGFTAAQWAALNSGITSGLVTKLSDLPTNAELTMLLNGKQAVINDLQTIREGAAAGATAYQKPSGGIPSTDMSQAVQTSLGKADQAATDITTINSKIPAAASALNPLVDKAQMDSATANFITKSVNDLLNYYLKSDTYTKTEVQQLIAAVRQFTYEVVDTLPTASASTMHIIYLVPSGDPHAQDVKDEYITIATTANNVTTYSWEKIGSTAIDMTNFYTKDQTDAAITAALNAALADYSTTSQMNTAISTALASYYTKTEIDAALAGYATSTQMVEATGRILFLERGLGKYDIIQSVTLSQAKAGKYVNVNGQETNAGGYGISNEVQLNAGDILLVPSSSAVPVNVSLIARVVTRTYDKVIAYTYTYQQANPELYDTATADYDQTLVYTAVYDTSGDIPVLTGWTLNGETYTTLPSTHEVTESYYDPLMKQSVAAMPSTGYYVYLCPINMSIVVSGYTATVNGGTAMVIGLGIFKNIATNFVGSTGQSVIAQAFAQMLGEIEGLKAQLDNLGETRAICINSEDVPKVQNVPMIVTGDGAPAAPNVPAFIGQKYLDTTNKKEYTAFSVTNLISDWVLIN